MKKIARCLAVLIAIISVSIHAQTESDIEDRREQLKALVNEAPTSSKADDPARPATLSAASDNPTTKKYYEQALQDYYRYRSTGLEHRRHVFKWQLFSAKIIFIVVLILVGSGIIFAAIQFRHGIKNSASNKDTLQTELELSTKGIKVSSPILGVIILIISLAFFYLYLVQVYPIENVF